MHRVLELARIRKNEIWELKERGQVDFFISFHTSPRLTGITVLVKECDMAVAKIHPYQN